MTLGRFPHTRRLALTNTDALKTTGSVPNPSTLHQPAIVKWEPCKAVASVRRDGWGQNLRVVHVKLVPVVDASDLGKAD